MLQSIIDAIIGFFRALFGGGPSLPAPPRGVGGLSPGNDTPTTGDLQARLDQLTAEDARIAEAGVQELPAEEAARHEEITEITETLAQEQQQRPPQRPRVQTGATRDEVEHSPGETEVYFIRRDGNINHFNSEDPPGIHYFLDDGEGNYVHIKTHQKNSAGLIQMADFSFTDAAFSADFAYSVKSGNEYRSFIRPDGLAAFFGVLWMTGTKDVTVTGFSIANGDSPYPSTSHVEGKNGDLRYLRKDYSGGAVLLQDAQMDVDRQNTFNAQLRRYAWKDMLSENFIPHGGTEQIRLQHTKHFSRSRHHNHLHLQGFNPALFSDPSVCANGRCLTGA